MLKKTALLLGCVLLLAVSWLAVLGMKSPQDKQIALVALADAEIKRGTYVNAEPHLLEAASMNTQYTQAILDRLKIVYLGLEDTRAYVRVLETQTSRNDCPPAVFDEFARFHLDSGRIADALGVLRLGVEKTGDAALKALYEKERYAYSLGRATFDDATAFQYGMLQVQRGNLWGLVDSAGSFVIPCEYEQISALDAVSDGCVVAIKGGKAITLNRNRQTIANTEAAVTRIGNLSQDLIPLQISGGKWILANSKFVSANVEYDAIGTVYQSAVAVKSGDRWGVFSLDGKTIVPFEYDEILMDDLGRCIDQGAIFARKGDKVTLYVGSKALSGTYEDARPFAYSGWAAVKIGGKWGFVDTTGTIKIQPQYDDAMSFSGNLAAVLVDDLWGYLAATGNIAIAPRFLQAKPFFGRFAPVLTEEGYRILTLVEQ